jgi:hypothetical protein
VALATGFGRRLGALLLAGTLVPSTIAKYPFWTRDDPDHRAILCARRLLSSLRQQ